MQYQYHTLYIQIYIYISLYYTHCSVEYTSQNLEVVDAIALPSWVDVGRTRVPDAVRA